MQRARGRRARTRRRLRGGAKTLAEKIESVKRALNNTPLTAEMIAPGKPESKYVVATYWWGSGNVNRNLQDPCPEVIQTEAKALVVSRYPSEIPRKLVLLSKLVKLAGIRGVQTVENAAIVKNIQRIWNSWQATFFSTPERKAELAAAEKRVLRLSRASNVLARVQTGSEISGRNVDRTFDEMIEEWNGYCGRAGVNHIALNTEFGRDDYQAGINAKPLFIKKLLDMLQAADPVNPKGVLYIDGDMWIHRYLTLFDIEGVDFMARGWNVDCRSKEKPLNEPFFDPMIFETSGGTMYFGNTLGARRLLDAWAIASEDPKQEGKADDRILSQTFTTQSLILTTNIINLPIEYLWLTDLYNEFLPKLESLGKTTPKDALIEHPYCLTGEERAADQGAAASRTPAGYEAEIEEAVKYNRPPELIYEYIMFNGHQDMRDEMTPYLSFLSSTSNFTTKDPIAKIVPFAERYGEYNAVADANLAGVPAEQTPPTGATESVTSGSVKEILAKLRSGINVWTGDGEPPTLSLPDIECYATDASTRDDGADPYTRFVQVDARSPMFFSAASPILQHLLAMSATLEDMNMHLKKNYTFLSRIRWEFVKPETPPETSNIVCAAEFPKIVHQVWFGGGDPGWRAALFEKNRVLCEKYGYTHKLWVEGDRTPDNFPITFAYQETAKSKGNTRWAQVADLARLEILYDNGGIYADSIIELSPALFLAIEGAVKKGSQFIGCNEDPCDPFGRGDTPCRGAGGREFLTNSFFANTRANPIFERLLDYDVLDRIDFDRVEINQETGPYFLRTMITDPVADRVFLLKSSQMFQYNTQETQSKKVTLDPFIVRESVPGAVEVKAGQYFVPGGTDVLQRQFLGLPEGSALTDTHYKKIVEGKGPLAIYHSGLGGTWST